MQPCFLQNQLALNQSKIQDKVQKKEKELKELSQAEESLKVWKSNVFRFDMCIHLLGE